MFSFGEESPRWITYLMNCFLFISQIYTETILIPYTNNRIEGALLSFGEFLHFIGLWLQITSDTGYNISFYRELNLYFWRRTNMVKCLHAEKQIQRHNRHTLVYWYSASIFWAQDIWSSPYYCCMESTHSGCFHTLVGVLFI